MSATNSSAAGSSVAAPARRGTSPPGRALDRAWILSLCLAFAAGAALGQTNPAPSRLPANRYLLIFENSRSMQNRSEGLLETVRELLESRLGGQLEAGDTLGIWTFNEELSAGVFPLQRWSAETHAEISSRVLAFVERQRYEKQARFECVSPALKLVLNNSEFITVILLSTGPEIRGTPFDGHINGLYQRWRKQQQESRMPFVTALRAHKGNIVEWSVTPAPWPLELPAVPSELRLARSKPPSPAPEPKTAPSVPPLIISGKKSQAGAEPKPATPLATNGTASATLVVTSSPPAQVKTIPASSDPPPALVQPSTPPATLPVVIAAESNAPAVAPPTVAAPPQPAPPAPVTVSPPTTTTAVSSNVLVPAPDPEPSPATSAPVPAVASSSPTQEVSAGSSATDPAGSPVAVGPAGSRAVSATLLWGLGLAGGACAAFLFWWWRARTRASEHVSLITRSLDRKK